MPIFDEGSRRVMILGGGDIAAVGTMLTDGPKDEINGLAFFELHSAKYDGVEFNPDIVADMPLHIIFKNLEAVKILIGYLEQVRLSMIKNRGADQHVGKAAGNSKDIR